MNLNVQRGPKLTDRQALRDIAGILASTGLLPQSEQPEQTARQIFREQLRAVEKKLEQLRAEIKADVVAFYLACDPFLPNFLRCLAAPKAKYPEACSHFRLRRLEALAPIAFFERAEDDEVLTHSEPRVQALIQKHGNPIFGGFQQREGIVSRGRLIRCDEATGRETALLTVNFTQLRTREEWQQMSPQVEKVFDRLRARAEIIEDTTREDCLTLYPSLIALSDFVDPAITYQPSDFRLRLRSLLERAVRTLDGYSPRWCCTIHLLDAEGENLVLAASVGEFEAKHVVHRIADGEGVICWVALRKQAVRIKNLPGSKFFPLNVPYTERVLSQMVVPILSHDRLIGTLSLESPDDSDAFRLQWVGYLSRVASFAAVTELLARHERAQSPPPSSTLRMLQEYMRTRSNPDAGFFQSGDGRLLSLLDIYWEIFQNTTLGQELASLWVELVGMQPNSLAALPATEGGRLSDAFTD